jgi:hypothetical protein
MMTYSDVRLLIITAMVLMMVIVTAYSYHRDQAVQSRRLVRIPVRTHNQRGREQQSEEEPNEVSPVVYYIGFLMVGYLIAMFLLAV